ncbi:NucA/NucB deoxyribonuclease domain-containing protein [Dyella acidiphila]|uniref:Deoxyribonuclease NucA/NucB domain-containing protein n=1 Tax=Dyella acidiphila TaxID=2775866 RepID=A0ABR9G9D6_9GAMM|nr:NucA/NucB deoxyribonuclease domain-containing protein [Dyella acidiphila]MBE1160668.1 hypothetical protein [Dyella acidiphila]
MRAHANDLQQGAEQNESAALSRAGKGGPSAFKLRGESPKAAEQRRVQQLANDSEQVTRGSAMQQLADRRPSVQTVQLREKHKISRASTPYIHEFTSQAIDKGAPTTLTYVINKNSEVYVQDDLGNIVHKSHAQEQKGDKTYRPVDLHSVNRNSALTKGVQLDGKSKSHAQGLSRDEFPYASTMQGGTDSYWAYVPATEQSTQGGQLAALYKRILKDAVDPDFDVELD